MDYPFYREADLGKADKVSVNADRFRSAVDRIRYQKGAYIIKGGYALARFKLKNGSDKRIWVSTAYGYFVENPNKGYYYLAGEDQKFWSRQLEETMQLWYPSLTVKDRYV